MYVGVDESEQAMARSNMTVAEAARETGFQFHFSHAFKQAFGRSPSAFRRSRRPGIDLPEPLSSLPLTSSRVCDHALTARGQCHRPARPSMLEGSTWPDS
ncbi:helix-turn-helix domain-containing protein [Streptomyces sp. NPDC059262]|uniref:helix-turn-helix domain-containing protein n=1 Tax=Streptomyces sp. NPDC059262 TaxID=3346797 RepID=UPI0036AAA157